MPSDSLTLSPTPVIFSFPGQTPLSIVTGVNKINWTYALNTNVTSTYGGEVVQILSCFVDKLTCSGNTESDVQLSLIYQWFLTYMSKAGLHSRDEQAIHMSYPERGWDFYIQVTNLPNFTYGTDLIANEWSIEAEVVADNDLNYLASYTHSSFTDVLLDKSMLNVGFNPRDPRIDPLAIQNGGPGDLTWAANMGNNFQSLLGAWATGDFAHWGFSSLANPQQNKLNPNSAEYWLNTFKTIYIDGKPATGNVAGSANFGGTGFGGRSSVLSGDQNTFANDVANANNLDFAVVAAWIVAETGQNAPAGPVGFNFLNVDNGISKSFSGVPFVGSYGSFPKFASAADAAKEVTYWIQRMSNYAGIKASGGQDAQSQLRAIYSSPWDSSHYNDGQNLINDYNSVRRTVTITGASSMGYQNPFRSVSNLGIGRIDEGVDYTGSGNVFAIGPGHISYASSSTGWPGGTYISYTLGAGAARGRTVYVAENFTLARNWSAGDQVDSHSVLGAMHDSFPYIETGWSQQGTDTPMAHDAYTHVADGTPMAYGVNFAHFLKTIGAPAPTPANNGAGSLEPGWPRW